MQTLAGRIQLLESGDQKRMPWKNGGGVTRELAVFPSDAGLEGEPFQWRISIADVDRDGPFSKFPGYDRTIMLIAGRGMELQPQGQAAMRLAEPYQPWQFSGDVATDCRLLDGPVRDFNVMSARDRIVQHCDVIRDNAAEAVWRPDSTTLFCHCLRGKLIVKLRNHAEWLLDAEQSLWFQSAPAFPSTRILLAPNSSTSVAALVSLRRL